MKTRMLLALLAAALAACGERIESPAAVAAAPEITTATVKPASPYVSDTSRAAASDGLSLRPPPDYKDSAPRLDTSR